MYRVFALVAAWSLVGIAHAAQSNAPPGSLPDSPTTKEHAVSREQDTGLECKNCLQQICPSDTPTALYVKTSGIGSSKPSYLRSKTMHKSSQSASPAQFKPLANLEQESRTPEMIRKIATSLANTLIEHHNHGQVVVNVQTSTVSVDQDGKALLTNLASATDANRYLTTHYSTIMYQGHRVFFTDDQHDASIDWLGYGGVLYNLYVPDHDICMLNAIVQSPPGCFGLNGGQPRFEQIGDENAKQLLMRLLAPKDHSDPLGWISLEAQPSLLFEHPFFSACLTNPTPLNQTS